MKTKLHCSVVGLFLLAVTTADAQTLTSHLNGNWNDGNTWGGGIPGATTDVIIRSTDTVGIPYGGPWTCRNLTINAGGMLMGPGELNIVGVFTNNGAVTANSMNIGGDLANNGVWKPTYTTLVSGTKVHSLSQGAGKSFEGQWFYSNDTLGAKATSDLTFRSAAAFRYASQWTPLDMQGHSVTVDGINRPTLDYLNLGLLQEMTIVNPGTINVINNGDLHMIYCKGNPTLAGQVLLSNSATFDGTVTIQGTLGRGAATNYIRFNNLINNGTIGADIQSIEVSGNITNNGIWKPSSTFLTGTQRQQLSQAAGKAFEGGSFSSSDTAGVKATSALTFRTATNFGYGTGGQWTTLDMQNYGLTIDGINRGTLDYLDLGYITAANIVNARDITCVNNGVLHILNCTGNINLHQRIWVSNYVTLIGTVTITDTLRSSKNGSIALTINGNITNLGITDGNLELDVTGNITNRGIWSAPTYLLTGGANRKIRGRFDGPVTFQQTGTPAAGIAQVDTTLDNRNTMTVWGVTLEVPNGSALYNYGSLNSIYGGSISNKGKISYPYKVTTSQNYNFFAGSATIPTGTGLDSLIFEQYGYQVLSTYSNACKSRWNIIPRPSTVQAKATSLKFHYNDDELGSNVEASLQVYQSLDTNTWALVSTASNITRDVSGNNVTLTGVSLYGNYALGSSPPASVASQNLLVNPDAEAGSTTGWVDADNVWEASTTNPSPHKGNYYFDCTRFGIEFTKMYQDVNVSSYASGIDAGNKYFTLSGWMEDWDQNPNDKATLAIAALSASGSQLSYASRDHRNPYWGYYMITGKIPANTRTLRVYLIGTRFNGTSCDAFFDDLSLTLADNPPAAAVSITSQTGKSEVPANGTLKLSASSTGGSDASYAWSSSYDRIATVDNSGLVTAVGSGVVTIQAIGSNTQAVSSFTITSYPSNYIEFTNPAGGESWKAGSSVTINWKVIGTVGSSTLSWSSASGTNWQTIATISNPSVQQYTWSIPTMSQPQGECYLKMNWGTDESASAKFSLVLTAATSVAREQEIPRNYVLQDNFPNPFNPSTTISFGLPEDAYVSLRIYNLLGAEIKTLAQDNYSAGYHTMRFDASNLPSGVYLYSLRTSKATLVKKMLLLR